MDRNHAILHVLADGHFHSGETLAKSLGITRAAVWKKVHALEKIGLSVFRVPGKGYRLADPLQLLHVPSITEALSPDVCRVLKAITVLDSVDSTNLWVGARNEDPEVCFAEFQSAGRGRRGRSWVSPFAANLYLSLSWRFDEWPPGFTALGMVTAIAAVRALESLGIPGVRIKWPNDLVAADRKLGGVLIDIQGEPPRATRAVIGLGVNVRMPSQSGDQIDQPWMDLATLTDGNPPERNRLAAALVESLVQAMQEFAVAGFAAFSADWQALDLVSGRTVALHSHDQTVTGVAAGVDEQGALLLKTPSGLKRFVSGDISLRIAG
ncbi:MAG TPA: bifunctional biotin--[acetyl-CoA-carboxylase] ligase/biotin operon repressor BirA [Gammaproteobacteria bacterium]